MFGCEPKVGLTSTSLPHEIIERLETEDLLSTLQASSNFSATNSADSPQHSIANSAESSRHTSEAHEHSPQSSPHRHTPEKSACHSPETSLHNLPSSEENQCALESSVYTCSAPSPQLSVTSSLSKSNACSQENSVHTLQSTEENESTLVTSRQHEICAKRKRAREAQAQQAERMVKRSRIDLKAGEIGDNVAVPIPMVDRGRGDPRNILGVILNRNENDLYRIAVKEGVLKTKYTRTEFTLCPQHLLTTDDFEKQ